MVGVARKGMTSDELRDSLMQGPAQVRHPPGRRRDRATRCWTASPASRPIRRIRPRSTRMREQLDAARSRAKHRRQPAVLSGDAARRVRADRRELGRAGLLAAERRVAAAGRRKAVRHRSRLGQGAERANCSSSSTSTRSTGSITISARRRCRTSWCCASPTACSSRSGTATTSTTCRSPSPNSSASATAAASTTRPARCATWCRTICSSCCRWWRWSRRSQFDAHAVRAEKAEVLAAIQLQSEAEALRNSVRGQYLRGTDRRHRNRRLSQDRGRRTRQHHRDLCGAEAVIDNWRWAGVPFYLRTGKALGASAPRSRSSSSRRRSRCSAARRWSSCRRTIS